MKDRDKEIRKVLKQMKDVKCINNNKQQAWIINGHRVCMVTHPDYPNWSGHSRGRKIHLQKDENSKLSICNMLVDSFIPDNDKNWAPVSNGKCKICFDKSSYPRG